MEKAEELLCAGISPGKVERKLADDYFITERQARKYIAQVYARWQARTTVDAPHRREKIIRMAERFYAKALVEKQYTAAANALGLLAKMSGAFVQHDPARDEMLARLGPPPEDPTLALVYAQRCMLFALSEVVSNSAIEPERRLRWISEIGAKIGMTYARTLIEQKLDTVTKRLAPSSGSDEPESLAGVSKPESSRGGERPPATDPEAP